MDIANILYLLALQLLKQNIFSPENWDIIVFKTPSDNRTDYVKRLIGLPGDTIQFIDGDLFINSNQILKSRISQSDRIYCGIKQLKLTHLKKNWKMARYIFSIFEKLWFSKF